MKPRLPFGLNNTVQTFLHLRYGQRREAEPCASTLNRGNDLVDVVADNAEPNVLGVLLDYTAQGRLCCGSHHVRLVQNDEFEALGEQGTRLCEILDLLPYNVNATVV